MIILSLTVVFKHWLQNYCPLYLQHTSVRADMLEGFLLGKSTAVLPRWPVLESLSLPVMTSWSPQVVIWLHFWTSSVPFSILWTLLFYLLANQLPRFLTNPEVWTFILGNDPVPIWTPSLSHPLYLVSQEKWLWKILAGSMFMSGCKALQLDKPGSRAVEYILTASLYLNLDPLKQLYAHIKILLLHVSALKTLQHKAEGSDEGETRPNWQFLLRPIDSHCLPWKWSGLNAFSTVCMNLWSI